MIPFLITFLLFLSFIFTGEGYGILQNGNVGLVPYKYFYNLLEMPVNTFIFIIGVIGVLIGIFKTLACPQWKKGIWFAAPGTILTVISLFIIAGFNNTAFYPSNADPASSLTIYNASSSEYTLKAMSYVSLIIPIIILYIWYVWRAMTRKPMNIQEVNDSEHKY